MKCDVEIIDNENATAFTMRNQEVPDGEEPNEYLSGDSGEVFSELAEKYNLSIDEAVDRFTVDNIIELVEG